MTALVWVFCYTAGSLFHLFLRILCKIPSAGIPCCRKSRCSAFSVQTKPMPEDPACHLELVMSLLNCSSPLLESRGDPAAGSCFGVKTVFSRMLQVKLPTEWESIPVQGFTALLRFICSCVASFMRTMKTPNKAKKKGPLQTRSRVLLSQTKKVLIEFLNHRLREAEQHILCAGAL